MTRQIAWNKYEVALLIDAYVEIKRDKSPKNEVLISLSKRLRCMAENAGMEIDETFRNLNGMQWQYGFIVKAFSGEGFGTHMPSRLFHEMVSLYKEDITSFREILSEAYRLSENKNNTRKAGKLIMIDNRSDFQEWLNIQPKLKHPVRLIMSVQSECSDYVVAHNISKKSFWDMSEPAQYLDIVRKLLGLRLFRVCHRKTALNFDKTYIYYAAFLKENAVEKAAQATDGSQEIVSSTVVPVADDDITVTNSNDNAEVILHSSDDNVMLVVDFRVNENYAYTAPIEFSYFDGDKMAVNSWKDLYVRVLQALIEDYPFVFEKLNGKSIATGERADFSYTEEVLRAPKLIKTNYYAETNLSACDIVKHIKLLLDKCKVDYENLIIKYRYKLDFEKNEAAQISNNKQIGSDADEVLHAFSKWLLNKKGASKATASGYASNLRSISAYCGRIGIASASFITAKPEELPHIVGQIMQNAEFQKYNAEQHNRFSAALKKFLEYRTGVVLSARTPKSVATKNDERFPYCEQVSAVLRENYPYGFRLESTIDIKRFRRYAESQGLGLPESDDALKAEIKNAGVKIDDKVYLVEAGTFEYISNTIKSVSSDGSRILFYDCIYDSDISGMEERHITSADLLKAIMKRCRQSIFDDMANIYFAKNFLSLIGEQMERDAVTVEMQRIWGEPQTRMVDELSAQLPAIPDEYVKRYLSGSSKFVWCSESTYFNMQRFIISEAEQKEIVSFVASECESKGYASISDITLGDIAVENYALTTSGLQEAIYNRVLINKYSLNGKILTKKTDDKLDVISLAKQYLADKERCTFDDIDKKIIELAGTRYRYMAYEALYSSMVRSDKEHYVAHQYVKFDIDVIDEVLSTMISDRFVAIKEITSFALFPLCGLPWNHYLLESYCYSYSKKFCLKMIGFNDKNAGIIAENDVTDGYNELLAQAAARAKIELSTETVGQYFFETGHMGKRKFSDLESIVDRARAIREGL